MLILQSLGCEHTALQTSNPEHSAVTFNELIKEIFNIYSKNLPPSRMGFD